MNDVYDHWRARLAGKDPRPFALPTIDGNPNDDPQPGAYKVRLSKGGQKVPMRIWLVKNGQAQLEWSEGCQLVGTINGVEVDVKGLADRWHFAEPVSKADTDHYNKNKMWPGDIGHNSRDLSLAEEIKDAAKTALDWLKSHGIKNKETMDIAANHRARLNELANKADDERDALKRPHMEAAKAVDLKYKPLIVEAKEAADTLRDALTDFMRVEEKRRAEALEKARQVVAEAGVDLELPLAPEPVRAGGQRGRKAGLRTVVEYQIHDRAALLAYLTTHDNADLHAAAAEIGRKLFKAGVEVPGIIAVGKKVAA